MNDRLLYLSDGRVIRRAAFYRGCTLVNGFIRQKFVIGLAVGDHILVGAGESTPRVLVVKRIREVA
jgi:hypothetical protein